MLAGVDPLVISKSMNVRPPSTLLRIVPLRPTAHAVDASPKSMPSRCSVVPLGRTDQVRPASVDRMIVPLSPAARKASAACAS